MMEYIFALIILYIFLKCITKDEEDSLLSKDSISENNITTGSICSANCIQIAAVLSNRGNTYRRMGEYERAIADYDEALSIQPDDTELLNSRNNANDDNGEYDVSIEDWEAVLRLNTNHANARRVLKMAWQLLGTKTRTSHKNQIAKNLQSFYAK
jgi:tetratricopeptide (TPR) repeat protein